MLPSRMFPSMEQMIEFVRLWTGAAEEKVLKLVSDPVQSGHQSTDSCHSV